MTLVMTSWRGKGIIATALAGSLASGTAFSIWGPRSFLLFAVPLALGVLTLLSPEVVTLVGISALYLNLPGIATTTHGMPVALAASVFLLLVGPLLVRLLLRREPVVLDRPLLLIVVFLGAVLLSFTTVEDYPAATRWLITFLAEGLLIYFASVNLFRTRQSLRRALDVVVLCGAVLAALTIYQEATGSYDRQFWGLAQRNIEYGAGEEDWLQEKNMFRDPEKIHLVERAAGPIGDPNRYAQVLLVLLPLAYFGLRIPGGIFPKALCAVCGLLILAGVLLTYSRGAFVALLILLVFLKWLGGIRLLRLGLFAGLVAIAVIAWAPGYVLRVGTLQGVQGIGQEAQRQEVDNVIWGRLTEMLAALEVFLDHPLIGVGPGQFAPVYSVRYMSNPDIAFRQISTVRRAHTLYLELAAETGLIGLLAFLAVVGLIQFRLWRAWRRFREKRKDLAGLAAAFFIAICGYLVTAVFLQLAYQRYYWLLLGMAGAALQVLAKEDRKSKWLREGEGPARPSPVSPLSLYGGIEPGPAASSGASN